MTSGAHRVEESLIATLLGVPAITRATPEFVRRHTGQAIGGVAPLGHPEPIGTLVDVELARYDQVWAAAGHPHTVFPTTYDELLVLTGGTPAEVGLGPDAIASPTAEAATR
jgi:prolyl-tRNA editing enzyme YbaK/EbsC (Cys-tRNA(Pro) deacylase)